MPVSSVSGLPVPVQPQAQRPDAVDRLQRESRPSQNTPNEQDARTVQEDRDSRRVIANNDSERATVLRQENEQRQAQIARQQDNDTLPANVQRALQAFEENTPSLQERLGVEVVGVDTFA